MAGYFCFGLMWLASCVMKQPLCASYVKYNYREDKALRNPLFMKTNYVLAVAWGVLYIFTATWTVALRAQGFNIAVLVINNIAPVIMGCFTAWLLFLRKFNRSCGDVHRLNHGQRTYIIASLTHALTSGLEALLDSYANALDNRVGLSANLNEPIKRCSVGEKIIDKQDVFAWLQEPLCNDDGIVVAVRVAVDACGVLVSVKID